MTALGILDFVNARLGEREAAAKAAIAASAHCDECAGGETGEWVRLPDHPQCVIDAGRRNAVVGYWGEVNAIADHVCLNDPRWALADVAAKRRIVTRHSDYDFPFNPDDGPGDYAWQPRCDYCLKGWPCAELLDIAAADSHHPDYNPAWAVTG